jgi:replicative DNA helicase
MIPIKQTMNEVVESIKHPVVGLPTGLNKLTEVSRGYCPGQLIVIAGRSSMGKTALACDSLLAQKVKVLTFSLEMSSVVLIQRLIANHADVDFRKLVDNKIPPDKVDRVNKAIAFLKNSNIHIDDTPCLAPSQFIEKCEEHPDAKLVVVDYLQLMRHDNGSLSKVHALDDICQQLREYAKTRGVPVVLLSQLNRKADERDSHEPRLSDLRDSGGIEQVADVVLLLYRPSYYMQREFDADTPDDGESYIIVAKQRCGKTGKVKCVFIGEFMSFRNCAQGTMDSW